MSIRIQMLKDRADAAGVKARAVSEKATTENRPMTSTERTVYDEAMKELGECLDGIKAVRADASAEDQFRNTFGAIGIGADAKSGRRLSFKGMGAAAARAMLGGDGMAAKSLSPSGAALVAQMWNGDPVALGRAATGLLDVLPVNVHNSPSYAYLRQETRTNNAAVVAEGDTKPTSVIGLTRIEQTLDVVAHLSEPMPRYWLEDNQSLMRFVQSELEFGLRQAVEAKVLADVNDTSGIQTQDFSTSVVQTIRKALTKVEAAGHLPSAIALHPADFETVELAVSTANAVEHMGLPYDAAARRLFGVPLAVTVSATVGIGHVIAQDAVILDTDSQGIQVQWSENAGADTFARNLIVARTEGRYGTTVAAPLGVVVATLAD